MSTPPSSIESEARRLCAMARLTSGDQERLQFVDSVCEGRPELRTRVLALIAEAGARDADGDHRVAELSTVADSFSGGGQEAFFPKRAGIQSRQFRNYELVEEIARGGMGVVYKARQIGLNRVVAVKMILSGQFASEADVRRFRQEAEAAANLQHPNIVSIHEIGEHEGQHFYSMDFIEGRHLGAAMTSSPVSNRQAAEWIRSLADTVQYAHEHGVLHRDLKPQNVLVGTDGRLRVTDFGLAKRVSSDAGVTRTGAVLGSPNYMPPEQASGRSSDVGPASDVYSLGAILYEMLAGRPPFMAETSVEVLVKTLRDEPVPPSRLRSAVAQDLETVCLKCLEKEPGRRYATAGALRADLDRFLNYEPVQARPAGRARRVFSWGLRHPWAIAGLLSMSLFSVAGLAYAFWERGEFFKWGAVSGRLEREPGLLTTDFKQWAYGTGPVIMVVFLLVQWGLNWAAEKLRPAAQARQVQSYVGIMFGAASVLLGFLTVARGIAAFVWEGSRGLVLQNVSSEVSQMLHAAGWFLVPLSVLTLAVFALLPFQIGILMILRGLDGRPEWMQRTLPAEFGKPANLEDYLRWSVPGLRMVSFGCLAVSIVFGLLLDRRFGTGWKYVVPAACFAFLGFLGAYSPAWRMRFSRGLAPAVLFRGVLIAWLVAIALTLLLSRPHSGHVLGFGFSVMAGIATGGLMRFRLRR